VGTFTKKQELKPVGFIGFIGTTESRAPLQDFSSGVLHPSAARLKPHPFKTKANFEAKAN
jgi:hypothetical protein